MKVQVLWSDPNVIAAYKPAGIPAQPDRTSDPDLLTALQQQFEETTIGQVHRLDRPVSGVMLFGRNGPALAALSAQFREHRIEKRYWAIVHGRFEGSSDFRNVLEHEPGTRKAVVGLPRSPGEGALIQVTGLACGDRYSLVEVVPTGGAFHQIRAQLSAAGHPIKGDVKYGARRGEKDRSIALHARSITFTLPESDRRISCEAPVPDSTLWRAFVQIAQDPDSTP